MCKFKVYIDNNAELILNNIILFKIRQILKPWWIVANILLS